MTSITVSSSTLTSIELLMISSKNALTEARLLIGEANEQLNQLGQDKEKDDDEQQQGRKVKQAALRDLYKDASFLLHYQKENQNEHAQITNDVGKEILLMNDVLKSLVSGYVSSKRKLVNHNNREDDDNEDEDDDILFNPLIDTNPTFVEMKNKTSSPGEGDPTISVQKSSEPTTTTTIEEEKEQSIDPEILSNFRLIPKERVARRMSTLLIPGLTTSTPNSLKEAYELLLQQKRNAPPVLCTFNGYMLKYSSTSSNVRAAVFSRWKKRYFSLSGRHLIYSLSSDMNEKPKGSIDLIHAQVEAFENSDTPSGYELRMYCPEIDKKYSFCLNNVEETLAWFEAINNNIAVLAEAEKVTGKAGFIPVIPKDPVSSPLNSSLVSSIGGGAFSAFGGNETEASHVGLDVLLGEEPPTLYALLGLDPKEADSSAIRKAYFRVSKDYDSNPDSVAEFSKISNAFQVLKDEETKDLYDKAIVAKSILRRGMLGYVISWDQESYSVSRQEKVFFIDNLYDCIYWQNQEFGSILHEGYGSVELRNVQRVFGGADGFQISSSSNPDCILNLAGPKLFNGEIHLEFDTKQARDIMLDGLRFLAFWKTS